MMGDTGNDAEKAALVVLNAIEHNVVEKEVKIAWDGCYPYCPSCGSSNVVKSGDGFRGPVWRFCPDCGQRLKDVGCR